MYVVGDRLSIEGQLATVRYVGYISAWPDTPTLGVEWDKPERGKNSGNIGPVSYFCTKVPGAGSFLKANSKKMDSRVLFEDTLVKVYGKHGNEITNEIRFGSKVVENLGFEKLNELNSAFDQLRSVTLDKQKIFQCNKMLSMPNLVKMDLSFNLFNAVSDVWKIIDQLPQLQELSLNGNRFTKQNIDNADLLEHGLRKLKLSSTKLAMVDVKNVLKKFPKLKEINLASNDYTDEDMIEEFQKFDFVDLSFNNLTTVPNLKTNSLDVSDNKIQHLKGQYELKAIDLRNNDIDTWKFIDNVYDQMHLQELRIVGNPLFHNMEEEDVSLNLIARTDCSKINGTVVTPEERRNAELYVSNKVLNNEVKIESSKWQSLVQKYHLDPAAKHRGEDKNGLRDMKIQIKVFMAEQLVLSKTLLKDFSVLRLKGLIGKQLQKSILDFEVYHYLNGSQEVLSNDIARLQEIGLEDHEKLYIKLANCS